MNPSYDSLRRLGSAALIGIASVASLCFELRGLAQDPNCDLAPSSLVAWWPLNGNGVDIRSNNATTLFGNPFFVQGKVGEGLQFDGVDDAVRVTASPGLDVGQSALGFTVELWINPAHVNYQPILEWNNGFDQVGLRLMISTGVTETQTGKLEAWVFGTNGVFTHQVASSFGAIRSNRWQHVALRYSYLPSPIPPNPLVPTLQLWLDGVMVSSYARQPGNRPQTSYDLYLGHRPPPSPGWQPFRFTGILDEVAIYAAPLSDSEIYGIYAAGPGGKCSPCALSPTILNPPVSLVVNNGGTAALAVGAVGPSPITYQWRLNGSNLPAATAATYSILNVQSNHAGQYSVMISNPCGSVTSPAALLTVLPSPQIIQHPRWLFLQPGEQGTMSVLAIGPDLTYQWRREGTVLEGETNSTLTFPNAQLGDSGNYDVVVSNIFGNQTSLAAKLQVGTIVLPCELGALVTAVKAGGQYSFGSAGTIILTNTLSVSNALALDGGGHSVTISGGNSNRIFWVSNEVHCTLKGLTIANGRAVAGGGVYNADSSTLELDQVIFTNNQAFGPLRTARDSLGGAIFNAGGVVLASRCRFETNSASGASGYRYFNGSFTERYPSRLGYGGAIFDTGGTVIIRDCLFLQNYASGGAGYPDFGGIDTGRDGSGGAIHSLGRLLLMNSTFHGNGAIGGVAGGGVPAPSYGGSASGGAITSRGTLDATNCTWHGNRAEGAQTNGYPWTVPGQSFGGAIYSPTGNVIFNHVTLSGNDAIPRDSRPGLGGGLFAAAGVVRLRNSILANSALGSNCFGLLIDEGHNLSSDGSCNFTNVGSLNNTDPRLGPLADNGGPTPTIALLTGSPAIDAADSEGCPATDQRGVLRPQFASCDMGAFEVRFSELPALLVAESLAPESVRVRLTGAPNAVYRLLGSPELANWSAVATNSTDASGRTSFIQPLQGGMQFYRAVTP